MVQMLRRTGKPECISAAAHRAQARALLSAGQTPGCRSARYSAMASESHTTVEPSCRQGTSPPGENLRKGSQLDPSWKTVEPLLEGNAEGLHQDPGPQRPGRVVLVGDVEGVHAGPLGAGNSSRWQAEPQPIDYRTHPATEISGMKTSLTVLLAALLLTGTALAAETPAPAWGALELLQRTIPAGEKRKFSFQEVPTFEGSFLNTAIFAARGAKPGPTLCLTALVHGDERNGFEVARTAFAGDGCPAAVGHADRSARHQRQRLPDRQPLHAGPSRPEPGISRRTRRASNTSLIAGIVFETIKAALRRADRPAHGLLRPGQPAPGPGGPRQLPRTGTGPALRRRRRAWAAPDPMAACAGRRWTRAFPPIIYEAGLPLRFEPGGDRRRRAGRAQRDDSPRHGHRASPASRRRHPASMPAPAGCGRRSARAACSTRTSRWARSSVPARPSPTSTTRSRTSGTW